MPRGATRRRTRPRGRPTTSPTRRWRFGSVFPPGNRDSLSVHVAPPHPSTSPCRTVNSNTPFRCCFRILAVPSSSGTTSMPQNGSRTVPRFVRRPRNRTWSGGGLEPRASGRTTLKLCRAAKSSGHARKMSAATNCQPNRKIHITESDSDDEVRAGRLGTGPTKASRDAPSLNSDSVVATARRSTGRRGTCFLDADSGAVLVRPTHSSIRSLGTKRWAAAEIVNLRNGNAYDVFDVDSLKQRPRWSTSSPCRGPTRRSRHLQRLRLKRVTRSTSVERMIT